MTLPESAIPIVPGMYLLPGEREGRFPYSHSVLLTGSTTVLIDAGCGLNRLADIRDRMQPDVVIASHSHVDHIAGCWMFDGSQIRVPVYGADTFGRLDLLATRFTEPGEMPDVWYQWAVANTGIRPVTATGTYQDGDLLGTGTVTLQAIHAPGHTLDHMCLWEPEQRILLSFDVDLTTFGPWYGNTESDIGVFKQTIRRLMDLKPRLVVSSHKGIVRQGLQTRLQAFLDEFERRDRAILNLLSSPSTLDELTDASPIYHGYPHAARVLRFYERMMIGKHVDELVTHGLAERQGTMFVRTSLHWA